MGVCSSVSESKKILMLGLDDAGKTTLLYKIRLGEILTTVPTIGFNVETVKVAGDVSFVVWDIGGQKNLRSLWHHYISGADGLLYVVDSTNVERLSEAREVLFNTLNNENMKGVPVVIIANKQDLPGALKPSEISERMGLNDLGHCHSWHVQGASAVTSEGVFEGVEMMATLIKNLRK
ncbi:ADP-ribosylation factor-like [Ruditapes philippinarum]|uniref:ADP-ribosylation factor-like n=1 Tax=Ruditapes philippinarum TaxID=129788 RepID=UPI00295B6D3B|nr:ADP-ribosylation factor-like [Ruditapes philippinarum]